jgi:glyoxylase-like metal-dependent hydrolase (beta-lactamase superfamily II)
MELKKLNETCYYFESAVNIGYVHHGEEGLLIDAGIDKSSIKKVLRTLAEKDLPVTHLFITHAHADHYGGAHVLEKERKIEIIAPSFEKAILENPMLEPLYLFGGNDPLDELRNKFLEGKPIRVQHEVDEGTYNISSFTLKTYILPGHSYYQAGVVIDNIFYAGDAYFSVEQLNKHKIPYITDAQATLTSLEKAKTVKCEGAVPGHGCFESNFSETIDKNIQYHHRLLMELEAVIYGHPDGISHEDVVASLCESYDVHPPKLSQYLLYRTAVTAYIIGLIKQKKIKHEISHYRWYLTPINN